jgi:putative cell wall-binding protein
VTFIKSILKEIVQSLEAGFEGSNTMQQIDIKNAYEKLREMMVIKPEYNPEEEENFVKELYGELGIEKSKREQLEKENDHLVEEVVILKQNLQRVHQKTESISSKQSSKNFEEFNYTPKFVNEDKREMIEEQLK